MSSPVFRRIDGSLILTQNFIFRLIYKDTYWSYWTEPNCFRSHSFRIPYYFKSCEFSAASCQLLLNEYGMVWYPSRIWKCRPGHPKQRNARMALSTPWRLQSELVKAWKNTIRCDQDAKVMLWSFLTSQSWRRWRGLSLGWKRKELYEMQLHWVTIIHSTTVQSVKQHWPCWWPYVSEPAAASLERSVGCCSRSPAAV